LLGDGDTNDIGNPTLRDQLSSPGFYSSSCSSILSNCMSSWF
jgi:hypothetical protein